MMKILTMTMITKKINKGVYFAIIGLVVFFIALFYFYKFEDINNTQTAINSKKLKVCPDEWIDDQMPGIGVVGSESQKQRMYFILNGERMEMSEFDIEWVRGNCNIEPQVVF